MKFVFPLYLSVCLLLVNSEAKKTNTTYVDGVVSNRYFSIEVGEYNSSSILDHEWLSYDSLENVKFSETWLSSGTGKTTSDTRVVITADIWKWIRALGRPLWALVDDPSSVGSEYQISLMYEGFTKLGLLGVGGEINEDSFETKGGAQVKSAWAKSIDEEDGSILHKYNFLIASPKFVGNNDEDEWISIMIEFSVENEANEEPPDYSHFKEIVKNLEFKPVSVESNPGDSDVETSSGEESANTTPVINKNDQTTSQSSGTEAKTSYEKGIVSNEYFSIGVGEWDETVDVTDDGDPLKFPFLTSTVTLKDSGRGEVNIEFDLHETVAGPPNGRDLTFDSRHQFHLVNVKVLDEQFEESFSTAEGTEVKSAWGKFKDGSYSRYDFISVSPDFMDKDGTTKYASVEVTFEVSNGSSPVEYADFKKLLTSLEFKPISGVETSSGEESANTAINSSSTDDSKTNTVNPGSTEGETGNQSSQTSLLADSVRPASNGSSWYELDWFGFFFDSSNVVASKRGWVYHQDLGWLYLEFSSNDKVWCWASNKGWLWTSSSAYPYLYSDESSNWVYVFSESQSQARAFDFKPKQWTAWQDLTLIRMTDPMPGGTQNDSVQIQQIDGVLESSLSNKNKISSIAEIIRSYL